MSNTVAGFGRYDLAVLFREFIDWEDCRNYIRQQLKERGLPLDSKVLVQHCYIRDDRTPLWFWQDTPTCDHKILKFLKTLKPSGEA